MRILYYGPSNGNSGSRYQGLKLLGHNVEYVFEKDPVDSSCRLIRGLETRLYNGPVTMWLNKMFLRRAMQFKPELVWVEMGRSIFEKTLMQIKERFGCLLVNSYSDDFLHKRSRHYNKSIPLYDYIFAAREVNFEEYQRFGSKNVGKFWKGFAPETIYPVELTEQEREKFGSDVTFIGHCEPNRIERLSMLAVTVENMKIWGPGWNRYRLPGTLKKVVQYRSVWNEEYRKTLCGAKIVVHYLTRWNRDTQVSKSFEIPACGAFMLTERTEDHLACFEEDKEAVFFSTVEELIEKVRFYLSNDELRRKIARAGRERCIKSGYSNYDRIKQMLDEVIEYRNKTSK